MRKVIAKVCLAKGQVGFYDPLTNIHLTMTKPIAEIYQGMNTTRIKASIASKRLQVIEGSLYPVAEEVQENKLVVTDKIEPEVKTIVEPIQESKEVKSEEVETTELKKTSKKKSKKVEETEEVKSE